MLSSLFFPDFTNYRVLFVRGDVVEIETWCQGEGKIGTRRDWILKDLATGEVIGRATRYLFRALINTFCILTIKGSSKLKILVLLKLVCFPHVGNKSYS